MQWICERKRNWDRTFTYKEDNTQTYTAQNRKGGDYVHFLPLYHTLVRKYDCSAYLYCWVGQPMYYRDATPGHINHFGYYVWANALSQKIEDLGWHNDRDLRFGGAPQDPGFEMPIEPEDEKGNKLGTETLETTDIDFMLLLCFFFGSCHF
ncbi:MAG: hypothetical protein H7A23_20815 [Leptospiraceae bacterium]|nr:hypothetical protein [Leptospiraceae bacterium]